MITCNHYWRIRKWLPKRYGMLCRVLCTGRGPGPRNVLVEFPDGYCTVAPRFSVRRKAVNG